jgi:hypothetical protein
MGTNVKTKITATPRETKESNGFRLKVSIYSRKCHFEE